MDLEEAGGKWRAGDPAKSMRFFQRAIERYDEGLRKFPQSLDLAYNKARAQYEVATHPILVKQLQIPVLDALEAALVSHRYALQLDPENPDTLFNIAQVLTSIAESLTETRRQPTGTIIRLLEEAVEWQNKCLAIQETEFEKEEIIRREIETRSAEEPLAAAQLSSESANPEDSSDEQLAAVIEPVTRDTLIDTAVAQLDTLRALCEAISASSELMPASMLSGIEELSTRLLTQKLPSYTSSSTSERLGEIGLARATFTSSLLEAGFRTNRIDAEMYKKERDGAFDLLRPSTTTTLMSDSQSLMSFAVELLEYSDPAPSHATLVWNGLSSAISQLTSAASHPDLAEVSVIDTEAVKQKTHLLRGDCSLLQHRLSLPPVQYGPAVSNATQLLRNAEVFYRNASKFVTGGDPDDAAVATFRSRVAAALLAGGGRGGGDVVAAVRKAVGADRPQEWTKSQLEDMVDESLLPEEFRPA